MSDETTKLLRKQRLHKGTTKWTDRDAFALIWIAHQYTIRLDHLQWLLGQQAGRGAMHPGQISEGATRDVVTRWKKAGWVQTALLRPHEPFWIWPTGLLLRTLKLPYEYKNIGHTSLSDLDHLAAINEIRLSEVDESTGAQWISERQLLQGIIHEKGKELPHRPDGEILSEEGIVAIETELSAKKPPELKENLMELIRGEAYLRLKERHGREKAIALSQGKRSRYKEIWYFAPKSIRKQVRQAREELFEDGALTEEETNRLYILWYPLARTPEEEDMQQQEDDEDLEIPD